VLGESLIACHTVVVFWSAAAADSKAVAAEYIRALQLGKDIVPVLLDDTPVPSDLAQYQWLDFREFVWEGHKRAITKQITLAATVDVPGGFSPAPSVLIVMYELLLKAQTQGIALEWDNATENQMISLLTSRIKRRPR
jgi:hypothetical protein